MKNELTTTAPRLILKKERLVNLTTSVSPKLNGKTITSIWTNIN
ncbi:hypothetical protein [Arsenicibacter rosenii]|nr:hypothetical protein [Arsenicibacter rosenii]